MWSTFTPIISAWPVSSLHSDLCSNFSLLGKASYIKYGISNSLFLLHFHEDHLPSSNMAEINVLFIDCPLHCHVSSLRTRALFYSLPCLISLAHRYPGNISCMYKVQESPQQRKVVARDEVKRVKRILEDCRMSIGEGESIIGIGIHHYKLPIQDTRTITIYS